MDLKTKTRFVEKWGKYFPGSELQITLVVGVQEKTIPE
jgi:hypothetical protein